MQQEKNILVNRGIPRALSVSGHSSGRMSLGGILYPSSGSGGFHSDFDDLSDFDRGRIVKDLNFHYLRGKIISALDRLQNKIDAMYTELSTVTSTLVEKELAGAGFRSSESREAITLNNSIIEGLIKEHKKNLEAFIKTANLYSGGNPLALTKSERTTIGIKAMGMNPRLFAERSKEQLESYGTSYMAAKDAKILTQVIDQLVARSKALSHQLYLAEAADASALEAAKEQVRLKQFPSAPPGVSLDNNMEKTLKHDLFYPSRRGALFYSWFYVKVRNGGPLDYKKGQPQYENFGNFHYGAVGAAAGIPEAVLLRAAGAAQMRAGTSEESFGYFWADAPYGDDPVDQVWIKAGIDYAKSKGY